MNEAPKLGQRVRIVLEGTINSIASVPPDPDAPFGAMVFVPRPEWGIEGVHGWGQGDNIWVTLNEIQEVLPPLSAKTDFPKGDVGGE